MMRQETHDDAAVAALRVRPVVSFFSVLRVVFSQTKKKQKKDIFALNDKRLKSHITVIVRRLLLANSSFDKSSQRGDRKNLRYL